MKRFDCGLFFFFMCLSSSWFSLTGLFSHLLRIENPTCLWCCSTKRWGFCNRIHSIPSLRCVGIYGYSAWFNEVLFVLTGAIDKYLLCAGETIVKMFWHVKGR